MDATGSLEEIIAATIAREEDARIYVFELDPEDFRQYKMAYEVVKKLKSNPNLDIYTLGAEMFEKYKEAYDGFIDKGGLTIQLPEWISMLKAKRAKKKLGDLLFLASEKLKNPETKIEELRTLLVNGEDILRMDDRSGYKKADQVAHDVVEDAMDSWENGSKALKLPLVGNAITPLWGGEEIVVAGRPGMGKSAFMLELAYRLGEQGIKTGFISLEMDSKQLMRRMCQRFVDVSLRDHLPHLQKFPEQKKKFLDGMSYLKNLPIFFDDSVSKSLGGLLMTIEKMAKIEGVRIFFLDYLQLVAPPKKASRNDEVAAISRALKVHALRNNISIIVGSQLSRGVEKRDKSDKRPRLADLRDSGAIEQDADVVAFLYRPSYYDKTDSNDGETELIVAKQRDGGIGTTHLWFDLKHQHFLSEVNESV